MPLEVYDYGLRPDGWTWPKRLVFAAWCLSWPYLIAPLFGEWATVSARETPEQRFARHQAEGLVFLLALVVYVAVGALWLVGRTSQRGARRRLLTWLTWLALSALGPISLWAAGQVCRPDPKRPDS